MIIKVEAEHGDVLEAITCMAGFASYLELKGNLDLAIRVRETQERLKEAYWKGIADADLPAIS